MDSFIINLLIGLIPLIIFYVATGRIVFTVRVINQEEANKMSAFNLKGIENDDSEDNSSTKENSKASSK